MCVSAPKVTHDPFFSSSVAPFTLPSSLKYLTGISSSPFLPLPFCFLLLLRFASCVQLSAPYMVSSLLLRIFLCCQIEESHIIVRRPDLGFEALAPSKSMAFPILSFFLSISCILFSPIFSSSELVWVVTHWVCSMKDFGSRF